LCRRWFRTMKKQGDSSRGRDQKTPRNKALPDQKRKEMQKHYINKYRSGKRGG
jgi:hypothetical protein